MDSDSDDDYYSCCTSDAVDDAPVTDTKHQPMIEEASSDKPVDDRFERVRVNANYPAWHARQPPAALIVRGWRRRLRPVAQPFFPPGLSVEAPVFFPRGVMTLESAPYGTPVSFVSLCA